MQEFLVSILLAFSSLLGVQKTPNNTLYWKVDADWAKNDYTWTLKASTENVSKICPFANFVNVKCILLIFKS